MSRINQFREVDRQLSELLKLHDKLKKDPAVQKDIEFEKKVKDLVSEYGMSTAEVIEILASGQGHSSASGQKQLPTKTYWNPHTGKEISLKRASNKQLKAWKAEHGNQAVDNWIV